MHFVGIALVPDGGFDPGDDIAAEFRLRIFDARRRDRRATVQIDQKDATASPSNFVFDA
jgi:hypothetical protein